MKHTISVEYDEATGKVDIRGMPGNLMVATWMVGCLAAYQQRMIADTFSRPAEEKPAERKSGLVLASPGPVRGMGQA